MLSLSYISGKEAVKVFDSSSFDKFLEYATDENFDCFHEKNFGSKKEMLQFVAGLEAGGFENYSIVTTEEAKEIKLAVGLEIV